MNWNPSAAIPLLIGLFLFGVIYALIVYYLGNKHFGYTSLLVALGVAVTVSSTYPLIGWPNVFWVFLAFIASGVPMIAGDAIKGARERQAKEAATLELLKHITDRGIGEAEDCTNETPPTR